MRSHLLKSGIVAGLIAGLVFMVVEMVLVATVGGGSLWGPPRMIAAIALGQDVLPPPPSFDAGIFVTAMIVHFVLAAILGAIFALIVGAMKLSKPMVILVGVLFGLLVYLVNFYGFTTLFPWFGMARNAITIFAHAIFGAVLGWWIAHKAPPAVQR